MKNVVIFGATSAIAENVAKLYAKDKATIYLLARNETKLEQIKQDLMVRGSQAVHTMAFEADNFTSHQGCIDSIFNELKTVDTLFIAHGSLPDQQKCQEDAELSIKEININGTSVISLLTHAANKMEAQKSGNITVITSVAGDRGRQSNYIYGAAKGMVSTFLQGLSQRLHKSGVHVLDIKPGFVDTPMTASFEKGALWAQPDAVAAIIHERIEKRKNISYTPFLWFFIMTIIKCIPSFIFNKIKL